MIKVTFETLKVLGLHDQFCLELGSDLVEERKLLNHQIIIESVGHIDIHLDVTVQLGLDEEWLVTLLNFLDPHI